MTGREAEVNSPQANTWTSARVNGATSVDTTQAAVLFEGRCLE